MTHIVAGARIRSAFVPVKDPAAAAAWYAQHLGLTVEDVAPHSAQLASAEGSLTLMGPRSGIAAEPGLPWAPCSFTVDELTSARAALADAGVPVSEIEGAPDVCLFFTARDLDGNVVLVVDR